MKKRIAFCLSLVLTAALFAGCGKKETGTDQMAGPKKGDTAAEINIKDYGSIYVRFFEEEAPKAVENFIEHAKNGYYDGLTFHRIIEDFMIQGGDPTGTGRGGESIWGKAFEDEFSDDLYPFRGALCMANSGKNTNGSQFFIVQAGPETITDLEEQLKGMGETYLTYAKKAWKMELSEEELNAYKKNGGTPWLHNAHTVFGQVYDGYDVLDQVAGVQTDDDDMPASPVVIDTIRIFTFEE